MSRNPHSELLSQVRWLCSPQLSTNQELRVPRVMLGVYHKALKAMNKHMLYSPLHAYSIAGLL